MIFVVGGGGGLSPKNAVLIVTIPAGSTVTATKGTTSLRPTLWTKGADSTLECAIFSIPASKFDSSTPWTIAATDGASTASATVLITTNKEYEVELLYHVPNEYQEVEYLRADKNQFIDLGFKPSGATEFDIDFKIENASFGASNQQTIFGARTAFNSNVFYLTTYRESGFSSYAGDFAYGTSGTIQQMAHDAGIVIDSRMQVSFHNHIYKTSTGKNYSISSATINPNNTMFLFALGENNSRTALEKMYGNIYSAKFWSDSNTLIRELFPCYRISDSVPGMWDRVNSVFYTSLGSPFIVGPDV